MRQRTQTVAAGIPRGPVAVRLQTEHRVLLPFLAERPGFSLASAVEGFDELVGESHFHGRGAGRRSSV
jgi:hypothetical protein